MGPIKDIKDATVVITGASSGFGRGAALKLAELGANVVLAARRTEALDELAAQINANGGRALAVTADVSKVDDVQRLGLAAVAEFGGSYAPCMMGKVVDMFYFPLFQWENHPQWLSFLFDSRGYFFGPVFNLADAYISVAVVYLLIFQYKFFK